ncbi:hypothetical protein H4R34_001710 [Dimargaris verticillata]|uniref:Uncharacterized protein n=1 Tax=Dimargaris verticillata TaxID=2761393 RepID=A0A9W8B3W8_9FUNG|nr:hypothetical protein H4R34_001710 [Dimargaris verticillata]
MVPPQSPHLLRSPPATSLPPVSSSSASTCSPAVPPTRCPSRSTVSPPRFASRLLENERVYIGHILWYTWAGLRDASAWPTCLIVVYGAVSSRPQTNLLGLDVLSTIITFCYNAFWLYPVYCVSFLLNSVWYQEIADRVYTMRGGEAVRHSITYSRFEYQWINRNWSIEKRLDYIEGRWAYFLGFGKRLQHETHHQGIPDPIYYYD